MILLMVFVAPLVKQAPHTIFFSSIAKRIKIKPETNWISSSLFSDRGSELWS